MRTKILLLTAALSLAGIATSMAQVYSQNVVGYVNVTVQPGYNLLANPLKATNDSASAIFPLVTGGTFYKWTGSGYQIRRYDTDYPPPYWVDGNDNTASEPTLPVGDGFFYVNPGPATNITFVGEVLTGSQTNVLSVGYSLKGSKIPVSGSVTNSGNGKFSIPLPTGANIYKWTGSSYIIRRYDTDYPPPSWVDGNDNIASVPTINIGEGFFYVNPLVAATNWVQTLTLP